MRWRKASWSFVKDENHYLPPAKVITPIRSNGRRLRQMEGRRLINSTTFAVEPDRSIITPD